MCVVSGAQRGPMILVIHLKMCVGTVFQKIFQCFRLVFVSVYDPKAKCKGNAKAKQSC